MSDIFDLLVDLNKLSYTEEVSCCCGDCEGAQVISVETAKHVIAKELLRRGFRDDAEVLSPQLKRQREQAEQRELARRQRDDQLSRAIMLNDTSDLW